MITSDGELERTKGIFLKVCGGCIDRGGVGGLSSKDAITHLCPKRNCQRAGMMPRHCVREAEQTPAQLGRITSGDYTRRGECQSCWLP